MTICIAASCKEREKPYIVLCADSKVGTWAAQAEIGHKFYWAHVNWPAMISGNVARSKALISTFNSCLGRFELDSVNVLEAMQSAANSFRDKLANEIVQRNLSVSYDYLRKNSGEFPQTKVSETYNQIGGIDSGTEVIVTGFVKYTPYIFVVETDCTVTPRDNFACIGTGAYIAEPALYQRHQFRALSLVETLYHVYEAKRLGEIAEGVGKNTVVAVISPPNDQVLECFMASQEAYKFLEEKYEEYGFKSTLDLRWPKSRGEIIISPDGFTERAEKNILRNKRKLKRLLDRKKRLPRKS